MELYKKILAEYIAQHGNLDTLVNGEQIVHDICYQALCRIKAILEDDTLEDPACCMKIEEIICVFEDIGTDAGTRHDYG